MRIDNFRHRHSTLREKALRLGFGVALATLGHLPPAMQNRIGVLLGRVQRLFSTRMTRVTRNNLRHCFPRWSSEELERQVQASLIDTGRLALETSRIWYGPSESWRTSIRQVVGEEILQHSLQGGRGVILLAPHFGNWELLNAYLGARYTFSCLYQPPKITALQPLLKRCRQRSGSRLIEPDRKGIRYLLEALKRGEVIGLLPDQVPERTGWVDSSFFGIPVLNMTLPCQLAARTGAVMLLGVARRLDPEGFEISFQELPEIEYSASGRNDEAVCATRINRAIEEVVCSRPSQYQWEYKRFKKPRHISAARMRASIEPVE